MQIPCVIDLNKVNTERDPRTIKERVINAIEGCHQDAVEDWERHSLPIKDHEELGDYSVALQRCWELERLQESVESCAGETMLAVVQNVVDEVMDTM